MSSSPKCPQCGSSDIDVDPTRGDAACVDCGTVLENAMIVAEVGFQEDARGRSSAIGQHVNADGRTNRYGGALAGFSREATQITLDNGRRRLRDLANTLKMPSSCVDHAVRLFKLAVERNFHKGRRMSNVACACLYVVCRRDKTAHMLIDFADVLSTNVYVLGHTFLKLVQLLCVGLPIIDPSLYIHRFAGGLEFGDRTHAVAMTALRLLARMRRDWMSYGRRPAGLCGAAIIVAARMHNFYRTQAEVVRVVRIGNVALRTRLKEIDQTATAKLTTSQIESGGGDQGKETDHLVHYFDDAPADPPAFQLALKRKERNEIINGITSIQAACRRFLKNSSSSVSRAGVRNRGARNARLAGTTRDESGEDEEETAEEGIDPAERLDQEEVEAEVQKALESDELKQLEAESLEEERASHGLPVTRKRKGVVIREEISDLEMDDELSDLDEGDHDKYFLTEEEVEKRSVTWHHQNREYLEKQERLERMKREQPEAFKKLRPSRNTNARNSSNKRRRKSNGDSRNTGEEPRSALLGKKAKDKDEPVVKSSSKLNYAMLESLNNGDAQEMPFISTDVLER